MRTVIGLFDDRTEAMNAYSALQADGFSQADLDILTNDDRDDEPKLAKIRQYVPEPDASIYLEGVRIGGTILTAKADANRLQRAAEIMSGYNMVNIQDRARDWRATNADMPEMTTTANNSNVLEVIEEDLEIGKETVERGRMRVYSVVTEQPIEENVALREESIRVQRRPVDRTIPADPTLFQEKSVEVVERAEVPVVDKVARVVEEVVVGKDVTERVETVHDTVRRQDVQVEEVSGQMASGVTSGVTGGMASGMTGTRRDYSTYENDFRSYYTTNWANSGMTYDQYAPGFRYGYDLAYNDAYRGKRWSDIEMNARQDWERRNPGTTWDKVKMAVQHSWEKVTGER
jgi:uncharacterized protein (TIGR02271 family)